MTTAAVREAEVTSVKLLVVADGAAERDLVTAALEQMTGHFEVHWTDCLAGALERIAGVGYGCLLVDARLPEEEFIECVDALREVAADSGIVVLTDRPDDALGRRALRHGADDYLLAGELSSRQLQRAIDGAVERVGAQAKIRQLSTRLLAVLHTLGDGLIVVDTDGRVISANPAALEIVGIAEVDLLGQPLLATNCSASYRDRTRIADAERPLSVTLGSGQERSDVVAGIVRDDGDEVWVEVSTYPLWTSDGEIEGAVVTLRDIGARLAADDAMRFQAALLSAIGQAVVVTDPEGRITFWNPAAERMHGWTSAEVLGRPASEFVPAESAAQAAQAALAIAAGQVWTGDVLALRRDGTTFPALMTAAPVVDDRSELVAVIVLSTDITERKRAEEMAQALSAIVTSSADAIFTKSLDGTILSWNRGAERLYGYQGRDVISRHISLLDPDSAHTEMQSILTAVAAGETVRGLETLRRRRDGSDVHVSLTVSPIFDEGHTVVAASVIGRDISDRKQGELELTRQAMHDSLTGLPNRTLLADRLPQALAAAGRHGLAVAVLFLDLDQFKTVNDAHGYLIGDELLIEVARRLSATVGGAPTVARFGGDEFVIVGEYVDTAAAEQVAADIGGALELPIHIDGHRLYASASIGIAVTPPLESDANTLLSNANAAMYDAKAQGRARRSVFDTSLLQPWSDRLALSNELHEALSEDVLEVHYQPMVELATGRVVGVEALVRWWHPTRQWVPSSLFVALAEDRGLAPALDQWVLDRACADAAMMRESGALPPNAKMAVNISARSVGNPDLLDRVRQSAADAKLPLDVLELEVTETGLMADAPQARRMLQALRQLGIGIALDDFGTGYSSLIHLRQWPVSTIKVDRAFVEHITTRSDDLAITASVVDLGRAVNLRTIAEGVETREQLALLHRLGCTAGQGFLWSAAVTRHDFEKLQADNPQGFEPAPANDGSQRFGRRTASRATNEHGLHVIRRMHRDGASLATISAALNVEGYRTPTDLRWHSSSVARVITDIAYRTVSREDHRSS
jgi:diguanylate cyclase (GGDEF)-like protein/PAS domain S-box-containing protein